VGSREAAPLLMEGLQRLEYRGYDSAGLATLEEDSSLHIVRNVGKLAGLRARLEGAYPRGTIGVAHTRWATHGKPTLENCHPHLDCDGDVAVVHNGIVENHVALREDLENQGHRFVSETDTEVLPHLIESYLRQGDDLVSALRRAMERLEGSHAVVVMSRRWPDRLVAARVGNAGGLVIGYGSDETFVASDLSALLPWSHDFVPLADRELVEVGQDGVHYWSANGTPQKKAPQAIPFDPVAAARGVYKHFMLKEIMEQPVTALDTVRGRVLFSPPEVTLEDTDHLHDTLKRVQRVMLVGMGTSLHAAMIGRSYIEQIAGVPAEVDNSSEFRYRRPPLDSNTLLVSVAQSGETVDTLEAMNEARRLGARQITVCNTPGAQSTRIADGVLYTRCGPEIAVASTKTLTASIIALYLLACHMGRLRGHLDDASLGELLAPLARAPDLMGRALKSECSVARLARRFSHSQHFLFLGRGIQHPVAMEGALKLKEVSYIHAEGYPAGEMKHGPIALINGEMPVAAIVVRDGLRDKMLSNIEQVKARDGLVIALANEGDEEVARKADYVVELPQTTPLLMPLLTVLPMQLLAYHIALLRGCDVDQPRNLAKTVTVE